MLVAAMTLFNLKAMFNILAAKQQLKHKRFIPKVLEHRPIGLEDVFQPITQKLLAIQGFA